MDLDSETSSSSSREEEDRTTLSDASAMLRSHKPKKNMLDALVLDGDSGSSRPSSQLSLSGWERELRAEAKGAAAHYDELVERIPNIEIAIEIPRVSLGGDYPALQFTPSVDKVLEEYKENSEFYYVALLEDGEELEVSWTRWLNFLSGSCTIIDYISPYSSKFPCLIICRSRFCLGSQF